MRAQLRQPVRVQVHLHVMTTLHRVAPLGLHARGDLGLMLAQIGVLAELGEDRQTRVLGVAGVEQRAVGANTSASQSICRPAGTGCQVS